MTVLRKNSSRVHSYAYPKLVYVPFLRPVEDVQSNRRRSSSRTWDYCKEVFAPSSVSGISHIASAKTTRRRIFWTFIFLFSLIGFFYQTGAFLVQYREYQSIVQVEIQNEGSLIFPAVTLCNANRFKRSQFCKHFSELCPENISAMEPLTDEQLMELQMAIIREGQSDFRKSLGHEKEDLLVSCVFTGIPNVAGEACFRRLREFYDPDLGNCFTFMPTSDYGKELRATEADVWQKLSDLVLVVNVEANEYLEPDRSAAVHITFHSPEVYPDPFSDGTELLPGHSYNFGLKKTTVQMLPAPYSTNCTNYDSLPWKQIHDRTLSTRMCTAECSQNLQLKKCDFVTVELSLFFDVLPWRQEDEFDAEKLECAERVSDETKEYCRSLCRVPCKQSTYEVTMDSSSWPRKNKVQQSLGLDKWKKRSYEEIVNNLARVRVYFLSMEHTTLKHSAKYQPLELFSHLGGYVGIWLGISLLALCEFMEGLCKVIAYMFVKRKKKRTKKNKNNFKIVTHAKHSTSRKV